VAEQRTYCRSTSFEVLKVFTDWHLDFLVFPGIVLEHVGSTCVADLEVILDVDGEGEDARRVGESGGKDNKVGGELHVELRWG